MSADCDEICDNCGYPIDEDYDGPYGMCDNCFEDFDACPHCGGPLDEDAQ